jgi:tRNA 5-methylaminomethyl-2-thiouridine biosynthesis bifunctional protein
MFAPGSVAYQPLKPVVPSTDGRGLPYSTEYGDVYHAPEGPFAQAQYVFLQGNGLPDRWRGRRRFTVCETGFGLGMNFLALWRAWRADPGRPACLHFVSFEAHPLRREDLSAMVERLAPDEATRKLGRQLVALWPPLLPGVHRVDFEGGRVTLTLAFGDARTLVPAIPFAADAFFLDGYAPARNPEMWTSELLGALADHAVAGATAATWCSVGTVRRSLQQAGFSVERRRGLGWRTHMTVAVHVTGRTAQLTEPPAHVAVVGGGIAGAAIAHALRLRDVPVTLLDACGAASTHRNHVAAAVTPLVARDDNIRARLSRAGSQRALARWSDLPDEARPRHCGTVQLARDAGRAADARSVLAALEFPESWVRAVDSGQASDLAGLRVSRGGLYFQTGMLVRPNALIRALAGTPGIQHIPANIRRLSTHAGQWRLHAEQDAVACEAPVVVLANAMGARDVLASSGLLGPLPRLGQMHALAGEVTLLPAGELRGGPCRIVGGEGYLLPAVEGVCVAGSTYAHGALESRVTAEGQAVNLAKAAALLAGTDADAVRAMSPGSLPGWAGWRAVLPGRLPAIGAVPGAQRLFVATGFASRGMSWAALAGDLLAAELCGEPGLLERDLLAAIRPR